MEILGLLDALESMLLDGFKIPLTKKTLVNEERILSVIDKMRMVIQGGGGFAKKALSGEEAEAQAGKAAPQKERPQAVQPMPDNTKAAEIVQQAYQIAKEVREGADKYADEVLSNLELTSTRVLRTVKAGRERLGRTVQGTEEVEVSGQSK